MNQREQYDEKNERAERDARLDKILPPPQRAEIVEYLGIYDINHSEPRNC
jgi:hypothetical protein